MLLRSSAMDALSRVDIYCWHEQIQEHPEHDASARRRGRPAMNRVMEWATFGTALGSGVMAGVFFAFSAFVMPGLDRLPTAQSIAAMQSVNKAAITPAFMTVLFGTAVASVALAVWAVTAWGQRPAAPWVLAGSALYLIGAIVVTIAANVPLNNTLATVHPEGAGAAAHWSSFYGHWLVWNHVRAAASLGAAALMIVAFRVR
jgi:uncharacterized membrane protein